MAIRCGCDAEGDEIVFGPVHQCSLPECTCAVPQPLYGHFVCALHGIDPRERPYETTLDEQERTGD